MSSGNFAYCGSDNLDQQARNQRPSLDSRIVSVVPSLRPKEEAVGLLRGGKNLRDGLTR